MGMLPATGEYPGKEAEREAARGHLAERASRGV
jgi:hypothetical protein